MAGLQVVGVLGLFVWPAPITLKQIYLTITGVIVAYVFTWTPEWTSWTLLLAMAIYDLFAVLMPGGPLKVQGSCRLTCIHAEHEGTNCAH